MDIKLILRLKPTTHGSGYFHIDKALINSDVLKLNKKYVIKFEEMRENDSC